jgi:N-acetylglutamate synthase-like GNAT family acetyltransferase
VKIIEYDKKYKQDFIDFNTAWIVDNFGFIEREDEETFANIEKSVENGAMIYFAMENDVALATCMAMPMKDGVWEICKLASNKAYPHKGAGSAVFKATMDWAINHGAKKLFLLSNSKLKPALHIYEKFGFKEIKLDDYEYVRGDIAFEYSVTNE